MTILKLRFMIWLAKNVNYIMWNLMSLNNRQDYDKYMLEHNKQMIQELEEALIRERDNSV